jgi:hypothetical protein
VSVGAAVAIGAPSQHNGDVMHRPFGYWFTYAGIGPA